ncbi:MAG: hypothetical protein EA402_06860 [Planctomycetota bacterium]|nr:MAG: hypothetical protein EA402_06860 [Planctomycetota bacterium]
MLVSLPLLGLPVVVIAAVMWFVGSGGLIREAERRWADHLPGNLSIGELRLDGFSSLSAQAIAWRIGDNETPLRIADLGLSGDLRRGRLRSLVIQEPELRLSASNLRHWQLLLSSLMGIAADRPPRELVGPWPHLQLRQGRVDLGSFGMHPIHLRLLPEIAGSAAVDLIIGEEAQPLVRAEGQLEASGSLQLKAGTARLPLHLILQGLGELLPELELRRWAVLLPEVLNLRGGNGSWTADGSWRLHAELIPGLAWRGLERLQLNASGHNDGSALFELHLHHRHGLSVVSLSRSAEAQLQLVIQGDNLPLNELIAKQWPLPVPLPLAANLAGSRWTRDRDGRMELNLRVSFPQPWLGLRRLVIDEASSDDLFFLPQAGQRQRLSARLLIDSGHEGPLQLHLQGEQRRSSYTPAISRSLRLRFGDRPVSSATLLAMPSALGLLDGMPPALRLLIPRQLSLAGSEFNLAMPDLDGQLNLNWDQGHLRTRISSAIIDWAFDELDFRHPALGHIKGRAQLNPAIMRLTWNSLAPAPSLLESLRLASGLGEETVALAKGILDYLGQGEARIFWGRFPADSQVSLQRREAKGAATSRLSASFDDSNNWLLQVQDMPLALLAPMFPAMSLGGHLQEGRVVIEADSDSGAMQLRQARGQITEPYLSHDGLRWQASRIDLSANFSHGADGESLPESVLLSLGKPQVQRPDGSRASLPGLSVEIQRQDAQTWHNTLRLDGVPGLLAGMVSSTGWALPDDGVFSAENFDLPAAVRALDLVDSSGTSRSLLIPAELSFLLNGKLQAQRQGEVVEIILPNGSLDDVGWSPWLSEGRFELQGSAKIDPLGVQLHAQGRVAHGRFPIIGEELERDGSPAKGLRYALRFDQRDGRLQLHDLAFALTDGDGQVQPGKPLIHLSGHVEGDGSAHIQALFDTIDIAWLSRIEPIGLPDRLVLEGDLRALIHLHFDGQERLRSQGSLFPAAVAVDLDEGRLIIEDLQGAIELEERFWLLRSDGLHPAANPDRPAEEPAEKKD